MTQPAGALLLKMLKYFEVMLNIFEFFLEKEIVEYWLVYVNKFSWIILFLDCDNTGKLVPAAFSYVLEFLREKNKFQLKDVSQL